MATQSDKDFLKAHLIDTERMLALVSDHPVMSLSLQQRVEELRKRLEALSSVQDDQPDTIREDKNELR